jgi:TPR repeat protein
METKYLVFLLCIIIASCVQSQQKETVRICDGDGCVDRPRDYASHDPAAGSTKEAPYISVLKQRAESDARAAYDLGLRYFRGDGVRQDSYQALVWMRQAGELGDLEAQKALGRFYLTGLEEMGSDPQEAEKWLLIAASRGDQESKKLLAEATAAKKSEQAWYKWQTRWRPVFYGYWYRGYVYRTYWRNGYLVYY